MYVKCFLNFTVFSIIHDSQKLHFSGIKYGMSAKAIPWQGNLVKQVKMQMCF